MSFLYCFILTGLCSNTQSECTENFASLQDIDLVVRSPREGPHQQVQALIPGFNFTRNGSVTKWIVGAKFIRNANSHVTSFVKKIRRCEIESSL